MLHEILLDIKSILVLKKHAENIQFRKEHKKMTVKEMQSIIDNCDYWDARVKSVECNYFADEVSIIFDDEDRKFIVFHFIGCYKSVFDHVKEYDKFIPVKNMTLPQIPYFLQDIKIDEVIEGEYRLWTCNINMFPLCLEIWCKEINVINETNSH